MDLDNNQRAFFELLRAGLWENFPVHGEGFFAEQSGRAERMVHGSSNVDWGKVYLLAQEQSVQGLVLQGLEWFIEQGTISKTDIPQKLLLQWIGEVQMIEQNNQSMNEFIEKLIVQLRKGDVYAILVKGQGIAQCYERPLWRVCGDIDLLLSDNNYEKAKEVLLPLAKNVEQEYTFFKHLALTLDGWEVELHGTLYSRLSRRVDRMIDEVQGDVFYGCSVRSWQNGRTQVFLPAPDNDVIFIFTHFLHHFFFEGVGLRQICDWCRLLWMYKDSLNHELLESRIRKMGLMTEWKAFAAYASWLGMPAEAIPLYSDSPQWHKKAERINRYVLKVGNFGHNQTSAMTLNQPYWVRKFISFWVHAGFTLRHFPIFPKDSIVFFVQVFRSGLHAAVRGE